MADNPPRSDLSDIPEAVAAPQFRWALQIVWLIPLVAALIGGWLAVKAIRERGPTVTISFKTAEGLEAGKTKIKFKDVDIGLVKTVRLSEDRKRVIATAELVKDTEGMLVEDTRFWVVRARIMGGSVSGLGTLLTGSYIGVEIGGSTEERRDFVGLEAQPIVASDVPGRAFLLKGVDLASLDVGSPVFFRRIPVGQVVAHELDQDGNGVTFRIFVNAPYDKYVTANTRFWQASGIDVALDSNGIRIDTLSLTAILIGGIAFGMPVGSGALSPAAANTQFGMFASRVEAMKNPESQVMKTVMVFDESVRGLVSGAPIDFRGIEVGSVTAVKGEPGEGSQPIRIVVEADMYPARLRAHPTKAVAPQTDAGRHALIAGMVERGLRAQLRTGNLLTGQLYVALDMFPDAPRVKARPNGSREEFPTTPSGMRELQSTIASIAAKIQKLPLEEIGADLRQTLQNANRLIDTDLHQTLQTATGMMQRMDTELTPEATAALAQARKAMVNAEQALSRNSALQQDAREAMREVARAAQAFRILADYLERHPEALIRGKTEEPK